MNSRICILIVLFLINIVYSATFPVGTGDVADISDPFGPREKEVNNVRVYDFHEGIDIGNAPQGTKVYATESGYLDYMIGTGECVQIITEEDFVLKYLHIKIDDAIKSKEIGDYIPEGSLLGTTNSEIHLHFGWFPDIEVYGTPNPGEGDLYAHNPCVYFEEIGFISSPEAATLVDESGNSIDSDDTYRFQTYDIDDGKGKFFKIGIRSFNPGLNIQRITIELTDAFNPYFTSQLLKNGVNTDFPSNQIQYVFKKNCTIEQPLDCIFLDPIWFSRDEPCHTVYIKWYLNESNWENIDRKSGLNVYLEFGEDGYVNYNNINLTVSDEEPIVPDDPIPGQINNGQLTINTSQEVDIRDHAILWDMSITTGEGYVSLRSTNSGDLTFDLYGVTNNGNIKLNSIIHNIQNDNSLRHYKINYPSTELFDNSVFLPYDDLSFLGFIEIKCQGEIIETLNNVQIEYFDGTIYLSKTWSGDETVYYDVSLLDDVILTISSGSNINLGSHKIILNEGSIQTDDYNVIHPRIELKTGSTINGYYPSISSAISDASSGQTVEVYDSQTLSNNVTIPSGVTLQIFSTNLTLGSYKIVLNGGTILADNYNNINPRIELKTSSTVNGYYPSLASAIFDASSIQTVEVNDSETLSSDLTIPSNSEITFNSDFTVENGTTLTIEEGSILTFNEASVIYIYGILNAQGTLNDRIIFQKSSSASYWGGISFINANNGSILNYCEIKNGCGIDCHNTNITINNCYIHDNIGPGCYFVNTSAPSLSFNTISNNGFDGVYCDFGADITFEENGKSQIINNFGSGVYSKNSTVWMGLEMVDIQGKCSVYGNGDEDVYSLNNSVLYCDYVWWNNNANPPSSSQYYCDGTSTLYKSAYLISNPGGGSGLAKQIGNNKPFNPKDIDRDDPVQLFHLAMYYKHTDNIKKSNRKLSRYH